MFHHKGECVISREAFFKRTRLKVMRRWGEGLALILFVFLEREEMAAFHTLACALGPVWWPVWVGKEG